MENYSNNYKLYLDPRVTIRLEKFKNNCRVLIIMSINIYKIYLVKNRVKSNYIPYEYSRAHIIIIIIYN